MRRLRRAVFVLVATLVALVVTGGLWLRLTGNYHCVIAGELYRSARLTPAQLTTHLVHDKICTVIDLRWAISEADAASERIVCEQFHARYVPYPIVENSTPTREALQGLVAQMSSAPKPLLIHCEHGADRTGLAVALYLREIRRVPVTEAQRALSCRYGHLPWLFRSVAGFDRAFVAYRQNPD